MFNLGGIVYFMTRHHKYYMYSQTADVWTQQASPAQHGAFSQESVVCDLNYAYYACDDGIYVFNGSTESSITDKTIQDLYDRIPDKTSIHLQLYNNRLYVFWADTGNPAGSDKCDSCFVYNINLKVWESYDTHIPACVTIGRQSPSNRLLCGSNCFEQFFQYEIAPPPSDRAINGYMEMYADFGCAPIEAEIYTSYLHFGTPSQKHRITKWRPEFDREPYPWYVKCGYSLDFDPMVRYAFSVNLSNGSIWSERPHNYPDWPWATYYERATITPTKLSTIPKVYGQFYRCQICYQHFAAFEPFSLKSHTLCVQTQRIR
jgi:hypothetical protein